MRSERFKSSAASGTGARRAGVLCALILSLSGCSQAALREIAFCEAHPTFCSEDHKLLLPLSAHEAWPDLTVADVYCDVYPGEVYLAAKIQNLSGFRAPSPIWVQALRQGETRMPCSSINRQQCTAMPALDGYGENSHLAIVPIPNADPRNLPQTPFKIWVNPDATISETNFMNNVACGTCTCDQQTGCNATPDPNCQMFGQ